MGVSPMACVPTRSTRGGDKQSRSDLRVRARGGGHKSRSAVTGSSCVDVRAYTHHGRDSPCHEGKLPPARLFADVAQEEAAHARADLAEWNELHVVLADRAADDRGRHAALEDAQHVVDVGEE